MAAAVMRNVETLMTVKFAGFIEVFKLFRFMRLTFALFRLYNFFLTVGSRNETTTYIVEISLFTPIAFSLFLFYVLT